MIPPDELRLAIAAHRDGLLDLEQLADLIYTTGRSSCGVAHLLIERGLVDAAALERLRAVAEPVARPQTVAFEPLESQDTHLAPSREAPQAPAVGSGRLLLGIPDVSPIQRMLELGLDEARFSERYLLGAEIGRGGVGRVLTASDALMGRQVALKALLPGSPVDRQRRFVAEAQTTAQLEHPNVVPVYDIGTLPGGEPCFTMKWVKGRSLQQLLDDLGRGDDPELAAAYSRYRLLQIFNQVCMAVDYAHSKGVVHRDLKPDNIMLGDFGEVLLMDWGIAKTGRAAPEPARSEKQPLLPQVSTPGAAWLTMDGGVVGTPGYMPPEQAMGRGDEVDARSDVWALGAILYEILTGCRTFEGTPFAILMATATHDVMPPSERAPERDVPADLEEICMRALARLREERYPSARALHDDVERYLAGTRERDRRRSEAAALVGDGEEYLSYMAMLKAELDELKAELATSPVLTGHEPIETKRIRWGAEDRRDQLHKELGEAFGWAEGKFLRAAEVVPGHRAARRHLADMHWSRYREARQRNDHRAAADHLKAVGRHRDSSFERRLSAQVPLAVESSPPGAEVVLHRYVERDRILVSEAPRVLGQTPLVDVAVPTGRHLLELRLPDRPSVRLPLMAWQGDELRFETRIPSRSELGGEFVFVPAGAYVRGNDPTATQPRPTGLVEVAAFAIGRFPVSVAEYFEFLSALPAEEAVRRAPRGPGALFKPPADNRWRAPMRDLDGDEWLADWAVISIDFDDTIAFCRWRSGRDGVAYRLPDDDEWEKAARGTDGRYYPWGNHFDLTYCNARGSVKGPLHPRPMGLFATDESPYGVRDMAGGVREWTSSWFEANLRTTRGGAWSMYSSFCHAASRWGQGPNVTHTAVGFRLIKVLG